MVVQNFSKNSYNNDPDNIRLQIQSLLQWLSGNPHINARTDCASLWFFLHTCKYDMDRTKKKIKCFYQMRAERTEWFSNRNPYMPEIQALLQLGIFLPIDGVDFEQRKIIVVRTSVHNPKVHNQNDVLKVSKMTLDLLLQLEPENCANGIVVILDMNGVQLGHALQMTPSIIKRSVESWQAYPCQPKLLEFINAPLHVNVILNTFRMFMTPKMRSRLFVRKNGTSIKYANLPSNLGGNGLSYDELGAKWKRLIEENAEFFQQDGK